MGKFAKICGWLLILIFLVLAGAAGVTQTDLFRRWLIEKVIETTSSMLDGHLRIGGLDGNLWRHLQLKDVELEHEGKPVLVLARLDLHYRLTPLLRKHIAVSEIVLDAPKLNLIQDEQLNWNVMHLIVPGDSITTPAGKDNSSTWTVAAPGIRIVNADVEIHKHTSNKGTLPKRVTGLNLDAGIWLLNDHVKLAVENLSFETEKPRFKVATTLSRVGYGPDSVAVRGLQLHTDRTTLHSDMLLRRLETPILDFVLKGTPISLDDVRQFMPELTLYGNPKLEVALQGPVDSLGVESTLTIGRGRIDLGGSVNLAADIFSYNLKGAVQHLDMGEATHNDTLASDLNLGFRLEGRGSRPRDIHGRFSMTVDSSLFHGISIEPSELEVTMAGDSLFLDLKSDIEGATTSLNGALVFKQDALEYDLKGALQQFDIGRYDMAGSVSSNVSLTLALQGRGRSMQDMAGVLKVDCLPSRVSAVSIDSARFRFDFAAAKLNIREFEIFSRFGQVEAQGSMAIAQDNHFSLAADFADFSLLSDIVAIDSLRGRGHLDLTLNGPLDSLRVRSNVSLSHLGTAEYEVASFSATGNGLLANSKWFNLSGALTGMKSSKTWIDTSWFKFDYADSVAAYAISVKQGSQYSLTTDGTVKLKPEAVEVTVQHLDIGVMDQFWGKSGDPTKITIDDSRYDLSKLNLIYSGQELSLSGVVSLRGINDFNISASNVDISRLASYAVQDIALEGKLNLDAHFGGILSQPNIHLDVSLGSGKYADVSFAGLNGTLDLSNDLLTWTGSFGQAASDSLLKTSGKLPIRLSFSPVSFDFPTNEQLIVKASTGGLDLSFLQAFLTGVGDIKGKLIADIVLSNTLEDLHGVGPIKFIDGGCRIPGLGTKYEQVNITLQLKEKDVVFEQFDMRSGGGYVKLLRGRLSLSEQGLQDFNVKFKVKHFEVVNNKQMKGRALGTVTISGSVQSPTISGDLLIDQARIYYEEFKEETAVVLTDRPFFVIPPDSETVDSLGALRFLKQKKVKEAVFTETDFYKNLRGELALVMPRNVWIRSSDASIEVECDLEAVKDAPELEVFGECTTLRGFYKLFGNRFQIRTGELVFDGGPEINPELHIEATTIVTDRGGTGVDTKPEKHEFKVIITGTLDFPQFRFTLDDAPAEQTDVVSILIFGQSFTDLKPGQKNQIKQDKGLNSRAKGLVTGQLLKQLSNKLGSEFGLDVIQIESGGSLSDSKVRVGKYVTPEVFVSVSQDFSAEGNQIVELEYEIPKKLWLFNLLLQASSDRRGDNGLDVIWKVEW